MIAQLCRCIQSWHKELELTHTGRRCGGRDSQMSDALADALRTTQERVLAISLQIRAAQRSARRTHAGVPVKTRCPDTMATAQILNAMTGCIDKVAQAYARHKQVRAISANPWLDEGFGTACAGIHEAERQVLLDRVTSQGLRAVATTRQYLVEHVASTVGRARVLAIETLYTDKDTTPSK